MEKKVILIWFKRFDTVNQGLLRLLSLLLVAEILFMLWLDFWILFDKPSDCYNCPNFIGITVVGILAYVATILVFRILIWLYDGFVKK